MDPLFVGIISFIAGATLSGFVAYRFISIAYRGIREDPLIYPPNKHAQQLAHYARMQLTLWQETQYRLDDSSPATRREALELLARMSCVPGVWMVEGGIVRLQNGNTVQLARLMQTVENVLADAYKALDEAAGVVLEYAQRLPPGSLEQEGGLLYSTKCAFANEICRLAEMLGVDYHKNEIARFGIDDLWNRLCALQEGNARFEKHHDDLKRGLHELLDRTLEQTTLQAYPAARDEALREIDTAIRSMLRRIQDAHAPLRRAVA